MSITLEEIKKMVKKEIIAEIRLKDGWTLTSIPPGSLLSPQIAETSTKRIMTIISEN